MILGKLYLREAEFSSKDEAVKYAVKRQINDKIPRATW